MSLIDHQFWSISQSPPGVKPLLERLTAAWRRARDEQLRRYRSQELRVEIPPAAFKCGQSVLQWRAPWMKDAPETPSHYKQKNRPVWFSAEVASYCGYGHIKYAGQTTRAHQYHVY